MSAQTFNAVLGSLIRMNNYFCHDSAGNPAVGVSASLNVVSGDPTGLQLDFDNKFIRALKVGTYTITVTATNPSGSVTTDAAGDTDGTVDTIVVSPNPAPASQGWTYGS